MLRFEPLEERSLLDASGIVDLGPSDNVALDQPRVAIEVLQPLVAEPDYYNPAHWGSVGPGIFNTLLLDTGANGILAMATAVGDLAQPPYVYETQGVFLEVGVAGDHLMDISVPYRFDFAGTSGVRNTISDTRLLSDADNDFSIFGPWGLAGMPAMVDRVTTLDMTGWSTTSAEPELFMRVDFSDDLPPDNGHRYSVAVDNRLQFDPRAQTVSGDPPAWGDIPFLTAIPTYNGLGLEGNFLFDTGAQVSVISEKLAFDLGLDANGNGTLDDEATRFETVGGVGGTVTAPVVYIDEVRVPTEQGVDLVWTDLQWLVLDIELPGETTTLDGVFGSDLLTSGWVEAFFEGKEDGYFQQLHFDFREMDNGTGTIHFDLTPASDVVIPPGPGVRILETLGYTTVAEGGSDDWYRLVLTSEPTENVEVSFASGAGQVVAEVDGSPGMSSVTFTPTNWNVPQLVHVIAVNDDLAEGPHDDSVIHTVTSGDIRYDGRIVHDVDVHILDDDLSLLVFEETDGGTLVSEGGLDDTYTVRLKTAPSGTVYVQLSSPDGQLYAYDPSQTEELLQTTLIFSPTDWNVPKTVKVRAEDDTAQEGPHHAHIVHEIVEVIGNDMQDIGVALLSVDILDNDVGPVAIFESDDSTVVYEAGQTDSYTIVLNEAPTHPVRIDLTTPDLQVTAVNSVKPLETFLEFAPANWSTPQTVLVQAIDDDTVEGDDEARIVHAITSDDVRFDGLALSDVQVQIIDDDAPVLVFEETDGSTVVSEDGTIVDTYTVRLDAEPDSGITVVISTPDNQVGVQTEGILPGMLTFTYLDWNIPQTVQVSAQDDTELEGPHTAQIFHDIVDLSGTVGQVLFSVEVIDDDVEAVMFSETGGSTEVSEAGQTDSYTIVLNEAPTHSVRFDLETPDGQIRAVDNAEPLHAYVEFTPGNWSTPQTVLVQSVDDDVDESDHMARIVHTITSADPTFDSLAQPPIVVQVADNDSAGVLIIESDGSTVVGGGGPPDTYEIVLTSQPTGDVRVELTDGEGRLLAVDDTLPDNSFIEFTPLNWDVARTIRISEGSLGFLPGTTEAVLDHELLSTDANYRGSYPLTVEVLSGGLQGTPGNDIITVTAGATEHVVTINGEIHTLDPATVTEIHIDGLDGIDQITVYGTDGVEQGILRPDSVDVSGPGYTIYAVNVETITVDGGGGADDEVTLNGSAGSNRLYSYSGYSRLADSTGSFSQRVEGFETLTVDAPAGGRNYAYLYDSPNNDVLDADPAAVVLTRNAGAAEETVTTATGFQRAYVYATQGGTDTAELNGAATTRNRFYGYADYGILTESRRSFYFYARGFDEVTADSPGTGTTYAYLYDSSGIDALTASPTSANMDRAAGWSDTTATGFKRVYAYSTRGGDDTATLTGSSTGGNQYRGYPTYSTLTDAVRSFYHYARGFSSLTAIGSQSDTSGDRAYLYDSSGADTLSGSGASAILKDTAETTYQIEVLYFDHVYARSSDGEANDTVVVDETLLAYELIRTGTW